jgi:hypothetical protein
MHTIYNAKYNIFYNKYKITASKHIKTPPHKKMKTHMNNTKAI